MTTFVAIFDNYHKYDGGYAWGNHNIGGEGEIIWRPYSMLLHIGDCANKCNCVQSVAPRRPPSYSHSVHRGHRKQFHLPSLAYGPGSFHFRHYVHHG